MKLEFLINFARSLPDQGQAQSQEPHALHRDLLNLLEDEVDGDRQPCPVLEFCIKLLAPGFC